LKARVEQARDSGNYLAIWDKNGSVHTYFQTMETMNNFGKSMEIMASNGGEEDSAKITNYI
jgi:hypothetical protein